MANTIVEEKLENIESELYNLKSAIIRLVQHPEQKKIAKLKGLLKGIKIEDDEIKEAKRSLFSLFKGS